MLIYILLYIADKDNEGIHSLEIKGETIVLMFEDRDDAERYCGLLEAQDFPKPNIQLIKREEVEAFCENSGYKARLVEKGFVPQSDEDRLMLSPPERNLDVSLWQEDSLTSQKGNEELENIRKKLEDLL